jgi:hypothetical protein
MMGTHPATRNAPFKLDFAQLKPGYWRLSWPASDKFNYTVLSDTNVSQPLSPITNLRGRLPVAEFVVKPGTTNRFYRVGQTNLP